MKETAWGIVPLKRSATGWEILLIKSGHNFWGLPKGHPEAHETPKQTAERELLEETGLQVQKFLSDEILYEKYTFTKGGEKVHKTVGYFIAEVKGKVHLQKEELLDFQWIDLEKAADVATYPEAKRLVADLKKLI